MDFVYLAGACLLFSLQFIFNKMFESHSNGTYGAGLWYTLATAVFNLLYLLPMNGFSLQVSPSAVICSLAYTVSFLLCSGVSILALRYGKISVSTTYMLLGGFILPFLWGIIAYGEAFTVAKGIGIGILMLSLAASLLPEKGKPAETAEPGRKSDKIRFYLYCFVLFLTNGIIGIATTQSQKAPDAVSSNDFLMLCKLETLVMAFVLLVILGILRMRKGDKAGIRTVLVEVGPVGQRMHGRLMGILLSACVLYALCNGLANLLSLNCAKTMDASIQFPLLSGAVILLGALFGWLIYHEKIEKKDWLGLGLTGLGILCFLL